MSDSVHTSEAFGVNKYLWGNIPALDVLRLAANEGEDYDKKLNLLFAASGDLRNVIMTIARLPESYKQDINITINDRDLDVVARNAVILLIVFTCKDQDEAIDCIIHVWYSALIRDSDLAILQKNVRPLIEEICVREKVQPTEKQIEATWTFKSCSVRLELSKAAWDKVLLFTEARKGLTVARANEIRKETTLAESRQDYRDRHMIFLSSSRRVAEQKFRQDGILLPFSYELDEFTKPNPTIFQEDTSAWPMFDDADPLVGWPALDVEGTSSGPAKFDIYGKLFYYLRSILRDFLDRMNVLKVDFRLLQVDARRTPKHLEDKTFDRIEVSNISDSTYLAIETTLILMVPLLRPISENRHATIITLFQTAIDQLLALGIPFPNMNLHDKVLNQRLREYLKNQPPLQTMYDPQIIVASYARTAVSKFDEEFGYYMTHLNFDLAAQRVGAVMKEEHTIVEKWPYRLKLVPGEPGSQEEFELLMRGGVSGKERYVEWERSTSPGYFDALWRRDILAMQETYKEGVTVKVYVPDGCFTGPK
ncbi:monoterpene epsilon-lactone hydrolase [Fusarium heterosporum]|uniref:Monoterpene epsilon-lactone hydrolase n=1 Tax=Fusarium heterosporum TaxID=42747 RepID=A0A8H5U4G5_FUSHE|nr:monoterpene epsilon-lactone hydrolase [Fusarium heterosporum]